MSYGPFELSIRAKPFPHSYGSWAVWCIAVNMDKKKPNEPVKDSFAVDSEAGLKLGTPTINIQRVEAESPTSTVVPFLVGRDGSHLNPHEDSLGSSVEGIKSRDSVPMFGSSEETRLGTERMSCNGGELPM